MGAEKGHLRASTSSFLAVRPCLWSSLGQTLTDPAKALCRPQTAALTLACCPVHYPSFIHSFIQHLLRASHSAESGTVPDLKEPCTWGWGDGPINTGKSRMPTSTEEGKGPSLPRGIRGGFKEASFGLDLNGFQQVEMRLGQSRQRE